MQTELDSAPPITPPVTKPTVTNKTVLIDGMRMNIVHVPKGLRVNIKPMPMQRMIILGKGCMILENNGKGVKYVAPMHVVLDANYHYTATTLEDTLIYESMPTTDTGIAKIYKSPGERVLELLPEHFFSQGVYARKWAISANTQVPTHKHVYDHMSILASGHITVTADGNTVEYTAPAVLDIKKNIDHTIRAYEDSIWFCIHATSETDVDNINSIILVGDLDEPI
ncbi:hypothetical protein UFOVP1146_403 [uncultured Caudovirales phage]|uniref:Uncharacterized protein n=1 Tax=uncultured Caudovirales phage TaxID=2100421 RepID=A0A6J5NYB6_9CAUD|nr:hypothetical protein UFOVP812_316 [uncultured Caudovirales phage]CAB4165713.1 hypothetical protein UFOVP818_249 [uncultured Caudovirales phage]CAB4187057.1 hypothetical protein UFOVP1146_403 [uncultured Caudovirales phage]CAB4221120.1 hypothetical protein UFOVP1638_162 [uncultured Caudovirales phage]